jgi:hypothetical protein
MATVASLLEAMAADALMSASTITPDAMDAAKEPVPLPVTSPVRVIVWSPLLVPVRFSAVLVWATVSARGVAALPVLLPINELAARLAILASDTAPAAIVVVIGAAVGPPVTSPFSS